MEYRVVDVFADRPLEGNPLTVVLGADGLDDATMRALARETNHSETTFVTGPERDGAWPVRIFTPAAELPFAGHPTLGTAHVLGASAIDLRVGRIPVRRQGAALWMTQKPARLGPSLDPAMLERCLGVRPVDACVASTGTAVGLVQVADSDVVRAAGLDKRAYQGPDVAGLYVFATDSDHDIHARFFADFVGIHEDPATGGAAGPLAGYLHAAGELESQRTIRQGLEMGRPSRLHIRHPDDAPEVGGQVQEVAHGRFAAAARIK